MNLRVGIDVGGTFTDVTAFDEDRRELVAVRKYLSHPAQPAAVMESITADLARDFGADAVSLVLHGSTAALNTLLEGKGVRVGLLTTRGFRDVYEIGRQWRGEHVFDIFAPAPKMLLTRDRIFEIRERVDARGEIIEPLVAEDVRTAVAKLVACGIEAVAVCFLFAYANPVHEKAAADISRSLAPDLYLSFSHEVNPEWREYERTASTIANAYIGPPVSRYLRTLEEISLRRFPRSRALMMKSDGGAASAAMLAPAPIATVMSGPVAGVIGGRYLGDVKGIDNLITFDTGGTSCDMAVLPGRPLFKSEVKVAGHPLRTHTVDIETIGAGGGSIAGVHLGHVLKVGPQSAGADPGPACYGRGGREPTLTDALVLLGHLNPGALLGGAMPIVGAKAREAVAMRTITVERGYDPREFTLVPFGGMGPTIAGMVAAELGIGRILVPRDPGAFSAHGMLVTAVQQERSLTRITPVDRATAGELDAIFAELENAALDDLTRENFPRERLLSRRHAGMRYRGQSYDVAVPVPHLRSPQDLADLVRRFHDAHQRRYGHMAEVEAVEIVNFQVTAVGIIPKLKPKTFAEPAEMPEQIPSARRQAYFSATEASDVPVLRRAALGPGICIEGPAVVEEKTSSLVLYPGQRAEVDAHLNIEIKLPS